MAWRSTTPPRRQRRPLVRGATPPVPRQTGGAGAVSLGTIGEVPSTGARPRCDSAQIFMQVPQRVTHGSEHVQSLARRFHKAGGNAQCSAAFNTLYRGPTTLAARIGLGVTGHAAGRRLRIVRPANPNFRSSRTRCRSSRGLEAPHGPVPNGCTAAVATVLATPASRAPTPARLPADPQVAQRLMYVEHQNPWQRRQPFPQRLDRRLSRRALPQRDAQAMRQRAHQNLHPSSSLQVDAGWGAAAGLSCGS